MDEQTAKLSNDAIAAPESPAPVKTLEYDNKTTQITRNQMRFFLLLLAVNTFLFAAFICLPSASPFLKQMWSDYQAKRETEREAAKLRTLIDACMNYKDPTETLVYADPPADSAKLLTEAGRALTIDESERLTNPNQGLFGGGHLLGGGQGNDNVLTRTLAQVNWQSPSVRTRPQALIALDTAKGGRTSSNPMGEILEQSVAFLHAMTTPSGSRRLVWIAVQAHQEPSNPEKTDGDEHPGYVFKLLTHRKLTAYVFDADFTNTDVVMTSAMLTSATAQPSELIAKPDGAATLHSNDQWRIFAGQIDPANPSHVTIAYDIDGKPGVIDGWLKDGDRLMLQPRVGRLIGWNSGSEYVWDLAAAATTKPLK